MKRDRKAGLKQTLNQFQNDVNQKETALRRKNIFQGAGIVYICVKNDVGQAMGLPVERVSGEKRYVLNSISTNGALTYAEEGVTSILEDYRKIDVYANQFTYLL